MSNPETEPPPSPRPSTSDSDDTSEASAPPEIIRNIAFFGETGAGKSSLINLVSGRNEAIVSSNARGCTKFLSEHKMPGTNKHEIYRLYDTGGFAEADKGLLTYEDALGALKQLINQLSSKNEDGLHLLVMVLRKDRTLSEIAIKCHYGVSRLCNFKVPVLMVMTHFDVVSDPDLGLGNLMPQIFDSRMRLVASIAGCAADASTFSQEHQEHILARKKTTKQQILQQFKIHAERPGYKKWIWRDEFNALFFDRSARIFLRPFRPYFSSDDD